MLGWRRGDLEDDFGAEDGDLLRLCWILGNVEMHAHVGEFEKTCVFRCRCTYTRAPSVYKETNFLIYHIANF